MKTKVNMNIKTLAEIEYAANKLNINRSALIKHLVKCFETDSSKYIILNRNVQYQDKDEPQNWAQFHLCISEVEYERFTDMRKLCKMSLSLIIAVCVKKYLKFILKTKLEPTLENGGVDNWPHILFPSYCLLCQKDNSGYKFFIYWGIPDKLPEGYEKTSDNSS